MSTRGATARHADYVKNMICGAAQMDGGILVVSAADGRVGRRQVIHHMPATSPLTSHVIHHMSPLARHVIHSSTALWCPPPTAGGVSWKYAAGHTLVQVSAQIEL
jgi:hypothetical protein